MSPGIFGLNPGLTLVASGVELILAARAVFMVGQNVFLIPCWILFFKESLVGSSIGLAREICSADTEEIILIRRIFSSRKMKLNF